jgi:hypothetical protein
MSTLRVLVANRQTTSILLAALLLALSPSLGLCAPPQGSVTVTSGEPSPGNPVTIAWTLINTMNTSVTGSIVYYLNAIPLTSLNPSSPTKLMPGKSTSGTFTFLPVPGCDQISVTLINTSLLPHGTTTKPPILQMPDPGQPPKPQPSPAPGVPVVPSSAIFPASVSTSFCVSNPVPLITKDGLTAATRQQLLKDYAPLLLYSYDHGSDEQYAPIDVVPFVQASSLQSDMSGVSSLPNSTLQNLSSVLVILNPNNQTASPAGTIASGSPAKLYLESSGAAQKGDDWKTIPQGLNAQGMNVGTYGRAILLNLNDSQHDLQNDPALPWDILRARYHCSDPQPCAAQVIKLEYWQFFGYSHDSANFSALADHEGDWCTVQLYVDAGWWESPRPDRAILFVVHYLHGNQIGFNMGSADAVPVTTAVPARPQNDKGPTYTAQEFHGPHYGDSVELYGTVAPAFPPNQTNQRFIAQNNTLQLATEGPVFVSPASGLPGQPVHPAGIHVSFQHPVVYVEWGGHEFWPTPAWSFYGASKHNGLGQYSYFDSIPVDVSPVTTPPSQDDIALVTQFAGYWGASQSLNEPPQGPPLHCEWFWDPSTTTSSALLASVQNKQWTDPTAVQNGQLADGRCGANRPF